MYNKALEVLNIFYEHGYVAYIVGGYPRDSILEIKHLILIYVLMLDPRK